MWKKNKKLYIDYLQFYAESLVSSTRLFDVISRNKGLGLQIADSNTLSNDKGSIRIYFNDKGIRLHLTGSFFKADNLNDNISEAKQVLKIIDVHKVLKPFLISRIDIAENHYGKTLKNYFITNKHKSELTEIKNDGKLNSIYLGKRSSKSVLYRCYDKRADLNGHKASIERFGTIEYCKSEYELKRDIARKYDLDTSADLVVSKIEKVYKWISSSKRVHFVNPAFIPEKKVEKCYIAKPDSKDIEKLHKMVKGIYEKNFDQEQGLDSIAKIKEQVYGIC